MRQSTTKGFKQGGSLLTSRIRRASESRGFAISRVLTHWAEIAGASLAEVTSPVKISHARQSFGATLTILTSGSHAPLVEMQKEQLRMRVNAVYGYNAVSRIVITQTSPAGLAQAQTAFEHKRDEAQTLQPSSDNRDNARQLAAPVRDPDLKSALEILGSHVLSRRDNKTLKETS